MKWSGYNYVNHVHVITICTCSDVSSERDVNSEKPLIYANAAQRADSAPFSSINCSAAFLKCEERDSDTDSIHLCVCVCKREGCSYR